MPRFYAFGDDGSVALIGEFETEEQAALVNPPNMHDVWMRRTTEQVTTWMAECEQVLALCEPGYVTRQTLAATLSTVMQTGGRLHDFLSNAIDEENDDLVVSPERRDEVTQALLDNLNALALAEKTLGVVVGTPDAKPDEGDMNALRASRANTLMATYQAATGSDDASCLVDLLTDLAHWADSHENLDLERDLRIAMRHWKAEKHG